MTRPVVLRALTCLVLLGLVAPACIAPPPDGGARRGAGRDEGGLFARIKRLQVAGDHDGVLALADEYRALVAGATLVELELATAEALLALGRAPSALVALARAERELETGDGPLARHVHATSGDVQMALGRYDAAAREYQAALSGASIPDAEWDRLCLSAYIALREAGSGDASAWRARLRRPEGGSLAVLEQQLLARRVGPVAKRPAAVPAVPPGTIPSDPRALVSSVRTRPQWGAAPISGSFSPMEPIQRVTVHHSARALPPAAGVVAELRTLQRSHQQGNRWADIGYHFLVDGDGNVWEGRALRYQGAHAGNGQLNRGNIGVCLLGDFERVPPAPSQRLGLERLLDALCAHFRLGPRAVVTHQEVRPEPTACPGRHLQAFVDAYRAGASASFARQ